MKHCFSLVSTKAENLFLFFIICILLSFFTSTFFLFLFISARSDSLKQSSGRRKRIFEKKQKADCCCCCCCCCYFQTMMLQFRCQSTLILSFTVRLLCTPDIGKDKYFFSLSKESWRKCLHWLGLEFLPPSNEVRTIVSSFILSLISLQTCFLLKWN